MMLWNGTKTIFNHFADIDVAYDIWSNIDVVCGIVNMVVLCFMQFLDINLVTDETSKSYLTYMMLFANMCAMTRLCCFVLVIESYSSILMTIQSMMTSAYSFLFILSVYLFIMTTIFMGLFSDSSITYSNLFTGIRTMFDAVLG